MEDPIHFDAYGLAPATPSAEVSAALLASGAFATELAARKAANHSRHTGEPILVAQALTWPQAQRLIANPSPFSGLLIFQQGYGPSPDGTAYCTTHNIYYGGCLGCHVCGGRYAR